MKIALLHTATGNVALFDAAALHLGLPGGTLVHAVRADLLAAAETAGGLTPAIAGETAAVLRDLAARADAVVLACSTLGPSVDAVGAIEVPVLRVDDALAREAASKGGRVVALCTVETTLAPTTRLFEEAARLTGARVDVRLVPGCWAMLKAGDLAGYHAAIAIAADRAYDDGAGIVALAQASMTGAADRVTRGPRPLTSPVCGLAAAARLLR
ncbi:MAG: aspartate/glutamate racemase family protein [Phyllobacterium sp.]